MLPLYIYPISSVDDINDIWYVYPVIVFRVHVLASFRSDTWKLVSRASKISLLFIQVHIRLSYRSDKITVGTGLVLIFRVYHHQCRVLVHTGMKKNIPHISP